MMDEQKKNGLALSVVIVIVLLLLFVHLFASSGKAAIYPDTMISFFTRRIDKLETSLADTREELAEMRGEWRGRQNATTGVAAGVPTGLAGALVWWLKREKRKANRDEHKD